MIIEQMPVPAIVIEHRSRGLDTAKVDELVTSIQRLGLRTPITVRIAHDRTDDDGVLYSEVAVLVAGRHRLEAARILGWDEIPAVVSDGTETEAKMWEIAENLHRADLTVMERSEHIAEWIRLWEKREGDDPKPAQVEPVAEKGGRGKKGGINGAVRDLGIERNEAQRAIKIAGLSDDVKQAVTEAGIADIQSALLDVAKLPSGGAQLKAIEQKKHEREARKRDREKQKRRRAEAEEQRIKREESQKAKAERTHTAAKFLVQELGVSRVVEFFGLLGEPEEISSLGRAFCTGDNYLTRRLLTEAEILAKFGGAA
jgi:hypothetical protein